jgi:hypothetical protein
MFVEPSAKRQIDVQANTAIDRNCKALALAKVTFRKETP